MIGSTLPAADLVIRGASELFACDGGSTAGCIPGGMVAIGGEEILAAGIRAVDLQPGDGEKALAELRLAGAFVEEG